MEDKIINFKEVKDAKELLEGISDADFGIERFLHIGNNLLDNSISNSNRCYRNTANTNIHLICLMFIPLE